MCSCSTKGGASFIIGQQSQRLQKRRRWAEKEGGAEVARDRGGRGDR